MAKKSGKKKKVVENIKLINPETGFIYYKKKNKRLEGKLSLKKYDPTIKKHALFSEKKF